MTPMPPETTPKAKFKLVLAGSYQQFKEYCRGEGLNPLGARFVTDRFVVYPYTSDHVEVVRTGTYWTFPKYEEIEAAISAMHP